MADIKVQKKTDTLPVTTGEEEKVAQSKKKIKIVALPNEPEELEKKIKSTIALISSDEKAYKEYLDLKTKFYYNNLRNTVLIYMQFKKASYVATKSDYDKQGLKLHDNADPIRLIRYQEQEFFLRDGNFTRVEEATLIERNEMSQGTLRVDRKTNTYETYLYDVLQLNTTADRKKYIVEIRHPTVTTNTAIKAMNELVSLLDIEVIMSPMNRIPGYYDEIGNRIFLNLSVRPDNMLATLCSLYSLALLTKTSTNHQAVTMFEASSLGYMLSYRFGVNPDKSDTDYITYFIGEAKKKEYELSSSLERINNIIKHVSIQIDTLLTDTVALYTPDVISDSFDGKKAIAMNFLSEL